MGKSRWNRWSLDCERPSFLYNNIDLAYEFAEGKSKGLDKGNLMINQLVMVSVSKAS